MAILHMLFVALISSSLALELSLPDGDMVNCTDMKTQWADNDLLKNHKLQEWPSEFPQVIDKEPKSNWPTWEAHVSKANCPKGTIPVLKDLQTVSNYTGAFPIHEYATISTKTPAELYGATATVNVWQPTLETYEEMSIAQIWITTGSYDTNDLNTIEVGWQVLPGLYQDYKPRLFIYWTSDTYTTGCYNLKCSGFIQTSNTIVLGGTISPVSTYKGKQFELTFSIWKDKTSGNWWLSLGSNNSLVGYWPREIFGSLANYADEVQWGGEVLNMQNLGHHTTTQMGSGHFPDKGFTKSSYFRNLKIVDRNNNFRQAQGLKEVSTNETFYRPKAMFKDDWGSFFFYGGSTSGVASLAFSSFFLYLGFITFLMV